jgi:hypothetical protein
MESYIYRVNIRWKKLQIFLQTEISGKYFILTDDNKSIPVSDDPVFLFNDEKYLSLWPGKIISSYLINTSRDSIAGFCHFHCQGNSALSPFQAPFASVCLKEYISSEVLSKFIHLMSNQLSQLGYSRIYLKHYPDFYSGYSSAKLLTALCFDGFLIKQADINHYLKISQLPFESIIHPMQRRRIKKCIRNHYQFKSNPNNDLDLVFRKIQDFRMQKNIPVNISYDSLNLLFARFPERYHLYSVLDGDRIIAATCAVSVNKKVLYNFLPASDAEYSSTSPMVYLIKNVYEIGRRNRYRFLDLGVSSINHQPQFGLIAFKEHLGGTPGVKFQLEKISDTTHD